ncbi:C39 family peptidase [Tissierella pigra]|uniref:C39 family peptidase n=1 Tax=Tissierella pigra TaxID=2607614 RepID=A0A6N7Y0R0_9FIRM|nr:C39 family peptidase [Tissierella pigra]MBU5428237.1 C39 family peptidase [Tissierella pigra]MSU02444.1 C39 family peptidase [Tissierella pigra]
MRNKLKRFYILSGLIFNILTVSFSSVLAEGFIGDNFSADSHAPGFEQIEVQEQIKSQNEVSEKYFNMKRSQRLQKFYGNIQPYSYDSKRLNVPLRQQEETYYCGPASAQMTILYLQGQSPTQRTLASNMGTDKTGTMVYRLAQELNKYSRYEYTNTDSSNFVNDLIYSIDKGKPIIAHVRASSLPHSPGAGSGHFIVNTGYLWGMSGSSSEDIVYYNDPHYKNEYYGKYSCTWSQMVKAIDDRLGYYIRGI